MDFDSIISILLILLFFIFPTLLKRLSQKKKTAGPVQAGKSKTGKAKKLSLFEKLGEQIREYAQTIEREAQKGKQPQETYWDHLADDGEFQSSGEESFETKDYTEDYMEEPVGEPSVSAKELERSVPKPKKPVPAGDLSLPDPFRQPKLSSSHLQQAIIWSEILSKPVALREDKTIG